MRFSHRVSLRQKTGDADTPHRSIEVPKPRQHHAANDQSFLVPHRGTMCVVWFGTGPTASRGGGGGYCYDTKGAFERPAYLVCRLVKKNGKERKRGLGVVPKFWTADERGQQLDWFASGRWWVERSSCAAARYSQGKVGTQNTIPPPLRGA